MCPVNWATMRLHMSPFEIIMLVCFGAAWPFSIYKSIRTRQVGGKSLLFLAVVFVGYIAGILHKLVFHYDAVIFLYVLNALMVLADGILYIRNRLYEVRQSLKQADSGPEGQRSAPQ